MLVRVQHGVFDMIKIHIGQIKYPLRGHEDEVGRAFVSKRVSNDWPLYLNVKTKSWSSGFWTIPSGERTFKTIREAIQCLRKTMKLKLVDKTKFEDGRLGYDFIVVE
jgi:hypothetical protein